MHAEQTDAVLLQKLVALATRVHTAAQDDVHFPRGSVAGDAMWELLARLEGLLHTQLLLPFVKCTTENTFTVAHMMCDIVAELEQNLTLQLSAEHRDVVLEAHETLAELCVKQLAP